MTNRVSMLMNWPLFFTFIPLMFYSAWGSAQSPLESDLLKTDLLKNSRLVYEVQPKQSEYRLVMSSLKKINGRWVSRDEALIEGLLTRRTFELDNLIRYRDASAELQKRVAGLPQGNIAFACSGLDCGSSNAWANEIFKIKQLYGLDNYQYYAVVQYPRRYDVFYLVQRGNQRIYLQMDSITLVADAVTDAQKLALFEESLVAKRYWLLRSAEGLYDPSMAEDAELDAIVAYLRSNPDVNIAIVGHDTGAQAVQSSRGYAEAIAQQLSAAGVAADQLQVFGAGAYAPRRNMPVRRVEIILVDHK